MGEVSGYLYALRDEAGEAAENLRRCMALVERELAEAKGTLDRLESIASKAELAAELVAASDLEPTMSALVPPESGLTRIEKEPMSGEHGVCCIAGEHIYHQPSGYKCIHCGAPAGTLWGRYWCPDCDSMRLAALNKQFFEFQAALRGEQNDE